MDIVFPRPLFVSGNGGSRLEGEEEPVLFQSRNLLDIKPGKSDNCGFAAFATPLRKELLGLKKRVLERYWVLHHGDVGGGANGVREESPLVIAGEWIGPGVQKGVAISKLSKRVLVIVGIHINGKWMPDEDFADIEDEVVGIYNISKAGYFRLDLDVQNTAQSTEEIRKLVADVERSCPFGRVMGVEGSGEGIVWKAKERCDDPNLWFKTKADSFAVSHSEKLPKSATAIENEKRVENFAKAVVTEMRLEQGWQYMREVGLVREMRNVGAFLKWIVEDVIAEEQGEMERVGVGKLALKPAVVGIAKRWYEVKVKKEADRGRV